MCKINFIRVKIDFFLVTAKIAIGITLRKGNGALPGEVPGLRSKIHRVFFVEMQQSICSTN